jgi:hypothetical protein
MRTRSCLVAVLAASAIAGCDSRKEPAQPAEEARAQIRKADTARGALEHFFKLAAAGQYDAAAEMITEPGREYLRSEGRLLAARRKLAEAARRRFGDEAGEFFPQEPDHPFSGMPEIRIEQVAQREHDATATISSADDPEATRAEIALELADGEWLVILPHGAEYMRRSAMANERAIGELNEGLRALEAGRYRSPGHAAKWITTTPSYAASQTEPVLLLDGQPVRVGQLMYVRALCEMLEAVGIRLPDLPVVAWFLLDEECDRAGITLKPEELERLDFLKEDGPQAELAARLATRYGLSPAACRAKLRGAASMVLRIARSAELNAGEPPGDEQVREFLDHEQFVVRLRVAGVNADAFADVVAQPQPAEIEEHYRRYADVERPQDPGPGNYGYRWPTRFVLEYLQVDVARLREGVEVRPDEVRKFYENHPDLFRVAPKTEDGSATEVRQLTFEEARSLAEEAVRQVQAEELADRLMRELAQTYLHAVEQAQQREEELPSLATLREQRSDMTGLTFVRTAPVAPGQLQGLGGMIRACTHDPERRSMANLIEALAGREARAAQESAADPLLRMLGAQPPQSGPVLCREAALPLVLYGSRKVVPGSIGVPPAIEACCLCTLAQVVPPGTPSLDEVAEEIRRDLTAARSAEVARELAEELAAAARESGLEAALSALRQSDPAKAAALGELRDLSITRTGFPGMPGVSGLSGLIERVFALRDSTPPGEWPEHAVVAAPGWLCSWCVAEWRDADYAMDEQTAREQLLQRHRAQAWSEWTAPEAIAGRLQLALPAGEEPDAAAQH